ncbi:MAG: hypothetical protein H0X38_18840, partial [Planctomycetes bacterium]|nr:hypothetical protein [Planctomycetota bacterium]
RLQRSVSPATLLPVLLDLDHGRVPGMLADADFTRACTLRSADAAAFPSAPSGWTWALLRWTVADEGAALAARIRGDDYWPVSEGIDLLMSPWSSGTTLDAWWLQRARGDQDAAHALLVAAQARGVALPLTP